MSSFTRASRKKARLRLGILGPAGSGKTRSALLIAKGLGGKVALIDTENGSGELYSDLMQYDVACIAPPFTPEKYIAMIREAEASYDVVIVDSLSHAWAGSGGILEMHDKATAADRNKNSYTAWKDVTPKHMALVDALLQSKAHIIATMRTKTAYEVTENNGKKSVSKVGMAPVQREGMDYEFTTVFDLATEGHVVTVSKDRTGLFDGKNFVPCEETGSILAGWLESGAEVVTQPAVPPPPPPVAKTAALGPQPTSTGTPPPVPQGGTCATVSGTPPPATPAPKSGQASPAARPHAATGRGPAASLEASIKALRETHDHKTRVTFYNAAMERHPNQGDRNQIITANADHAELIDYALKEVGAAASPPPEAIPPVVVVAGAEETGHHGRIPKDVPVVIQPEEIRAWTEKTWSDAGDNEANHTED